MKLPQCLLRLGLLRPEVQRNPARRRLAQPQMGSAQQARWPVDLVPELLSSQQQTHSGDWEAPLLAYLALTRLLMEGVLQVRHRPAQWLRVQLYLNQLLLLA